MVPLKHIKTIILVVTPTISNIELVSTIIPVYLVIIPPVQILKDHIF